MDDTHDAQPLAEMLLAAAARLETQAAAMRREQAQRASRNDANAYVAGLLG